MVFIKFHFFGLWKSNFLCYKTYVFYCLNHTLDVCGSSVVHFFKKVNTSRAPGLFFRRVAPGAAGDLQKTFSFLTVSLFRIIFSLFLQILASGSVVAFWSKTGVSLERGCNFTLLQHLQKKLTKWSKKSPKITPTWRQIAAAGLLQAMQKRC